MRISGLVRSLAFANLFYILRKYGNRKTAVQSLQKLETLVKVAEVDSAIIRLALSSDFSDFEDAIQYYVAQRNRAEYLITRNTKDFKKSDILVCTPDEFLQMHRK